MARALPHQDEDVAVLDVRESDRGLTESLRAELADAERQRKRNADSVIAADLAILHDRIANALILENENAGALSHLRSALEIRLRLAETRSQDEDTRPHRGIIWSLERIGDLNRILGASSAAISAYGEAVRRNEQLDELLRRSSYRPLDTVGPSRNRAVLFRKIGDMFAEFGRHDDAAASYRMAIRCHGIGRAPDPNHPGWTNKSELEALERRIGDVTKFMKHYAPISPLHYKPLIHDILQNIDSLTVSESKDRLDTTGYPGLYPFNLFKTEGPAIYTELPDDPPLKWKPRAHGRPAKGADSDAELVAFVRHVYGPYFARHRDRLRGYIYAKDRPLYRKIYRYESKGDRLPKDISMPSEQEVADRRRLEQAGAAAERLKARGTTPLAVAPRSPKRPRTKQNRSRKPGPHPK